MMVGALGAAEVAAIRPRRAIMRFAANVGAGGSFDPALTLAAGAPTPVWTVIDGAGATTYNTAAITHTQTGAGDMVVTLGPASLYRYITQLDSNTDGLLGTLDAAWLRRMPALTQLYLQSNPALVCNWALADLPVGITVLALNSTASTITGALADLPAGMVYLALSGTASTIAGALADLPAGMVSLYAQSTPSAITGGVGAIAAVGLQTVRLDSTGRTQAQVDEIILRVWQDKPGFTFATPTLNVGGTNAAPTGIHQAVCPPTSGKEQIWDLVNGNCTAAGPEWTVTYTA